VVVALDDQNPYVRCAALRVLEQMGDRVLETVYLKLLEMASIDPYPNARKGANRTILTLKGFPLGKAHDYPGEEFTGN
jgi:vesicle coat complex subunit